MKPKVTVGTATSPDGTALQLVEHDGDYLLFADGLPLMSTRLTWSEEELARLTCGDLDDAAAVLIGGLGFGFTLRAALGHLPLGGRVVQVELVPEVVAWNRGPLARFADHPLDDPRVDLVIDDISEVVRRARGEYAAILLDVDNGPSPIVTERNAWLYEDEGLQTLRRALRPGGALGIWAAVDDPSFPARLKRNGYSPEVHRIRPRQGRGGSRHVVFVGRSR
jgi:spermidine synthase